MQEISRTFEVTAILFERVYDVLMSIHKEMHPCSPVMQEVGAVNRNLWENPWGRCFIAFDGKLSDACNGRENVLADIRRAAYAFDDGEYYEHMRRLGFPIVDIDGRIEGCLGIGAISATLDDRRKDELVSFIASNLANEYKPFDNTI